MNHPLNNVGYQRLRELLQMVLVKLDTYLDIKIAEARERKEKGSNV